MCNILVERNILSKLAGEKSIAQILEEDQDLTDQIISNNAVCRPTLGIPSLFNKI